MEACSCGLLEQLIVDLERLDFEGRKDAVLVFTVVMRRNIGSRSGAAFLSSRPNLLIFLLLG